MILMAQQLAEMLSGEIEGDETREITSLADITSATRHSATFLPEGLDESALRQSKAMVVVINSDIHLKRATKKTLIRVENATEAFNRLDYFWNHHLLPRVGIHSTAVIEPTAHIEDNCYIGPNVYIGENVYISKGTQIYANTVVEKDSFVGQDCIFYPNVTINRECDIGFNVVLQSGCVIGSDGCKFIEYPWGFRKIPQMGRVIIGSYVELGANTCIDRCSSGNTVISNNCIVGNLVQVGHDCEIGESTQMSSLVGIAGNTKIGHHCRFGGASGASSDLIVAPYTSVGGASAILSSVRKEGMELLGTPAIDRRLFAKASVVYKHLPEMYAKFNVMKREIELLKAKLKQEE